MKPVTSDELIEWTQRFVRYRSEVTDALEADEAVLGFVRHCVLPLAQEMDLPTRLDAMGNLLIEVGPVDVPAEAAVFAYAMTHPQAGMTGAFAGEMIDSDAGLAIRGRGVSEQKAAAAASLAAFVEVARSADLQRPLAWVLLTAGETGRHDAIVTALAALRMPPKRAVLAVGTNNGIIVGHRGRLDIEVIIHGTATHSSTPWLGTDATIGVRELLLRVASEARALGRHPRLGPASLVCTKIETAPNATHTLQGWARLILDRRLLPGESPQGVFEALRTALQLEPPFEVAINRGAFMFGHQLDSDSELPASITFALSAAGLGAPSLAVSTGALDAGYLQSRGVPAIMWGPGDPRQFHTDEESVLVADLVSMADSYRATLRQFTRR